MEKQTKSEVVAVVFPAMEEDPEENDLSYWEFINYSASDSDSDSDDVMSLTDASWLSSLSSSPKDSPIPGLIQDSDHRLLDYVPPHDGYGETYTGDQEQEGDNGYGNYEEEEEDDNEGDDGVYDLDDELVPWALSGKFERQRMRKLGKRAFAKMHTSKKSPFLYVKPGCVHGKHGLGLKHSL